VTWPSNTTTPPSPTKPISTSTAAAIASTSPPSSEKKEILASLNDGDNTTTTTTLKNDEDGTAALLHAYFALDLNLTDLYKHWSAADANFAKRAPAFTGIRILNQDAWETLIAFIISSANNISRISQLVQKLCLHYGPYIGSVEGEPFHDFPRPEALKGDAVEEQLRKLGFGYRAKYIADTVKIVTEQRPAGWLDTLRNPESPALLGAEVNSIWSGDEGYKVAQEALTALSGVGLKVADCVCLMGLGWNQAVPIDTHVWQIARRDYKFRGEGGSNGTLKKSQYNEVGDHFRKIWGPHAGWAQSVLFTANLKSFAEQAAPSGKGTVKAEAATKKTTVTATTAIKGAVGTQGQKVVETKKERRTIKLEDLHGEDFGTILTAQPYAGKRKRVSAQKARVEETEDVESKSMATATTTTTTTLRRSKRNKT